MVETTTRIPETFLVSQRVGKALQPSPVRRQTKPMR